MDARETLQRWLGTDEQPPPAARGLQGRLLQGTTPKRYRADVEHWLDFTARLGVDPWQATTAHVDVWASSRLTHHDDGRVTEARSPHVRKRRLSALSAFYAYAVDTGATHRNPVTDDGALKVLRAGLAASLPRTQPLTPEELQRLVEAADAAGPRERLALYLMLSGLRARQITGLDLEDLHRDSGTAKVLVPSGDGWKRQGLHKPVWDAVDAWLAVRPPERDESGRQPLLTAAWGGRLNPTQGLGRIAKKAAAHAGVPSVTPDRIALSPCPWDQPA